MSFLLSLFFGIVESFWRRWFGGWLSDFLKGKVAKWLYNILVSRGTQTVFNFVLLTIIFMINDHWTKTPFSSWIISHNIPVIVIALIMAIIFQLEFWSRGHGPAFDEGRGPVDDELIKRYQKVWWVFIPNTIIPKEHWYGFLYDFIWMGVRYIIGTVLIIPFIWSFDIMWLGFITTSIYALCHTIYERDVWLSKSIPFNMAHCATALAELFIGFIVGFYLTYIKF